MAIVRAPLKTDAAGKCSRWRCVLYNPTTHKQEWTTHASKGDAEAYERTQKQRLGVGSYIPNAERRTFGEIAALFLAECEARNRRTSTRRNYRSMLDLHLLPEFQHRDAGSLRKQDFAAFFAAKLKDGSSVELVNRSIRVAKAMLNYGLDREMVERNVLSRFRQFEGRGEKIRKRGCFTEDEVRALLAAARAHERALIGLLCLTGIRPGEAFAVQWSHLDLQAGTAVIERTWDHQGKQFTPPKTAAGRRVVALPGWLVAELDAHKTRTAGRAEGLVFAAKSGKPLNPSNVRRDIWNKLRKRAGVRELDLYSLRHTFASLARAGGESAFNVARAMGHAKSLLVDQVYAHSLPSGLASVAAAVAGRVLGEQPKLRVIDGGQRPVRQPLDKSEAAENEALASG
jgi:integrase